MKNVALIAIAIGVCFACPGCSQNSGSQSSATPSSQVQTSAEASVAAQASATSAGLAVSFTDISGYDGEQAIKDLAALGILGATSGEFQPSAPVTRGEFARWLVMAQNRIVEPEYHIRLAQGGPATFIDVAASDPNYPYIQGLANAGFVVGVDATHFAPGKPLTREQMIYIKAQVDEHSEIKTSPDDYMRVNQFSDASRITKKYVGAVYEDLSAGTTQTFSRVYGMSKLFRPQQVVTRGEAAMALSVMKGEWNRSASQALGASSSP